MIRNNFPNGFMLHVVIAVGETDNEGFHKQTFPHPAVPSPAYN